MKKRNRFPSIKVSLLITLLLFIILFTTMPGFSPKLMSFAIKSDWIILIDLTPIEDVKIPETKDIELPKKITESNDGEESDITDFRTDFDVDLVIDDNKPELIDDLLREGWSVTYIDDLESYRCPSLVDSHIKEWKPSPLRRQK